jgi:hypothetical protein
MGITLVVAGLAMGLTAASEETDVVAVVHQFVDSFNKGDTKTAAAACADETSIIDEFPPYEWHGAGSCLKWMSDYDADAKKNVITDGVVTLHKPKHVDVSGDRAYVVVAADYAYKKQGKPVKQTASMMALALHKGPAGWRITGWSWAQN